MSWIATFQCLSCSHSWWEPAPAEAWEMVCTVAVAVVCPLCGAKMREGQVELLNHKETNFAVLCSSPHNFIKVGKSS